MAGGQQISSSVWAYDLDDRVAMGLPRRIVDRLPVDSRDCVGDLVSKSPEVLADIVEDGSESVSCRFFSGQLLALLGDPRIRPDMPTMVDIPGAAVYIGLERRSVDSVFEQWAPYGLQRDWLLKECPRHRVHVRPFRMMRYPITNREYHRFLADTQYSALPTSWQFGHYPHERANHPVWSISAVAASMYASWLSQRLGRRFRLPTEAEWEYAASSGDDREYLWGNEFHPEAANTVEAGPLSTTPVGMYPAGRSLFGVDDMAGNVEELVADDYAPYPGGILIDDDSTAAGQTYRVTRGGSFTSFGDLTVAVAAMDGLHNEGYPLSDFDWSNQATAKNNAGDLLCYGMVMPMKGSNGLESIVSELFWRIVAMRRLVVALCAVAGLVVTGSGIANAAAPTRVAERQIPIPVKEDPDDDWIPWDRVIGVFKSRQECITAGQALADARRGQYHCQKAKSTAWVLFK